MRGMLRRARNPSRRAAALRPARFGFAVETLGKSFGAGQPISRQLKRWLSRRLGPTRGACSHAKQGLTPSFRGYSPLSGLLRKARSYSVESDRERLGLV